MYGIYSKYAICPDDAMFLDIQGLPRNKAP
jgi:hypothetical protein